MKKYVTLMLTSKCNSSCKHCYISYKGSISVEEARKFINVFQNEYYIDVNGAELLTNLDYLDLYPIVHRDSLMTNGKALLEDSSLLNLIKMKGIKQVSLSYHYGIHDAISMVKSKNLDNLIRTLKKYDFTVMTMITIDNQNYLKIAEMCDYMHNLGVDKILFNNYMVQGCAQKKFKLSREQIQIVLEEIEIQRDRFLISELEIRRSGNFGNRKHGRCNLCCLAGTESYVISPDGGVYPCIYLINEKFKIGQVINDKIAISNNFNHAKNECKALELLNFS